MEIHLDSRSEHLVEQQLRSGRYHSPEEVVAGALTEYSGRGLALFRLGKAVELVLGLTLVATFYLGGVAGPLAFFAKTMVLLLLVAGLQAVLARLRIDQTVGLWWRFGVLLVLVQWAVTWLLQGAWR
jgi:NADH-quinone oxidoreductase subunit H